MHTNQKVIVFGVVLLGVFLSTLFYLKPWKRDLSQNQAKYEAETTTEAQDEEKKDKKMTNESPDLSINEQGLSHATVVLNTNKGTIKYKFYSDDAPKTISRIIELINDGFYDGLTFHRVVPGFVVQGGDPVGNGTGGSGQNLAAEFNKRRHVEGTVAMARAADPDSADSQFYISLDQHPHLDGNYTVFGQVTEGLDIIHNIKVGDKMTSISVE